MRKIIKKLTLFAVFIVTMVAFNSCDKKADTEISTVTTTTQTVSVINSEKSDEEVRDLTKQNKSTTEVVDTSVEATTESITENIEVGDMSAGNNAGEVIDLDGQLILQDENLEVRVQDIDLSFYPAHDVGASVKLNVLNKSDLELMVYVEKIGLNDFYMPTSFDAISVAPHDKVDGVIKLATTHALEKFVNIGKITKIDFIVQSEAIADEYKGVSEQFTYFSGEDYGERKVITKATKSDEKDGLMLKVLNDRLYDDGNSIIIPVLYMQKDSEIILSPKMALINGSKSVKARGFSLVKKGTEGILEVFIEKQDIEGMELKNIGLTINKLGKGGEILSEFTYEFNTSFAQ